MPATGLRQFLWALGADPTAGIRRLVPSLPAIELRQLIDLNLANNPSAAVHWPVLRSEDPDSYQYVETSDWWKGLCTVLPCFAGLQWPGYATRAFDATVNGRPVVIQLWKGWCPKFLGQPNFPGGTGGEVGVYERVSGRAKPTALEFLVAPLESFFLGLLDQLGLDQIWWPITDPAFLGNLTVEFTLINPITRQIFLQSGTESNTYWVNRWMDDTSYATYKAQSPTPSQSTDYILECSADGQFLGSW
jgi:hypothetical protein